MHKTNSLQDGKFVKNTNKI